MSSTVFLTAAWTATAPLASSVSLRAALSPVLDQVPMRFSAPLAPRATPTPAAPPPPPEAAAAAMIAVISEEPVAVTVRAPLPAVVIRLASTVALTEPRIRFEAKAPPPETPTPAAPPPARLIAAAAAAA